MGRNTRTKNVSLIALSSFTRQLLNLATQFISRTVFIYVLGADYLGLNGLFSNILSMLSLAELGIGAAITFYLFEPISTNDKERIKTLLAFYKTCYRTIGWAITILGIIILPFLPKLVNFEQNVNENLYVVFLLFVLNISCSYWVYAYKQSLPMANQEQYKIEKLNILFVIISCIVDVFVLCCLRKYLVYLFTKILITIVKNLSIAHKIDLEYPYVKENGYKKLEKVEIIQFFGDLKNVALFKLGSTLYNCTDNIIISIMLGTVIVGYYSNYFLIITAVTSVVGVLIRAFTAGIGNLVVKEKDKIILYNYFLQIDFLAYVIVAISTVALFQLLNSFMMIWVGDIDKKFLLSQTAVFFLCFSFYLDGTTQIINIFRESSGNFIIGIRLQILGGILNILLSIILGYFWGLEGIFASTVICKGAISLVPFLVLINKAVFEKGALESLGRYFIGLCITITIGGINWSINQQLHMTTIKGFLIECIISLVVSASLLTLFFFKTYAFRQNALRICKIFKKMRTRDSYE